MLDIRIRAWDRELKKMLYGKREDFDDMIGFRFDHFEDEDPVFMLSTLKYDVEGVEIYDGDIIGFLDTSYTESGDWGRQCIGVVLYDEETSSFQVSNRLSAESYEVLDECVVLGNVYASPDLLDEICF